MTLSASAFYAEQAGGLRPIHKDVEMATIIFYSLETAGDVLFVARGEVLAHMGPFLSRMAQAGASAELNARAPLPGSIVNPYIMDDSHD